MTTADWTSEIVEAMAKAMRIAQDRVRHIQAFTNQVPRLGESMFIRLMPIGSMP